MSPEQLTLLLAFAAGVVSFVSPCVLPLVPAYIANLSGISLHPNSPHPKRFIVLPHALLFVLGFSTVFIGLWTSLGFLGYLVPSYLPYIRIAGGIVLIFMGLHFMGLWKLPLLAREVRGKFPSPGRAGYPRSFLTGVIFSAGWTPCIGPVLAGIIGLASLRDTVWQGTYLLGAYSAGLALPFLGTALALDPLVKVLRGSRRYHRALSIVSGLFLIVVGFLMLTNMFILIPRYFYWGAL